MPKLSVEDLNRISERVRQAAALDEGAGKARVTVHMGTCGIAAGARDVMTSLTEQLAEKKVDGVRVTISGCAGLCSREPMATVELKDQAPIMYVDLSAEKIEKIVEQHIVGGQPVEEYLLQDRPVESLKSTPPGASQGVPGAADTGFFAHQTLVALRNRGVIDPEQIDEYIARDGYRALSKALTEMTPEEVIETMKASGLRGRGGGGFPTGMKWDFCRQAEGDRKYVICNADEGDPGAYMDRSIIESDPHSVLEGMLIGAYAMGAREGYVYIRAEYPLARKGLETAIAQAREYGLIGEHIFGSEFSFDFHIQQGAGAFVCGEETSLIASIEGLPPEPRQRPPFPAQSGLWQCPTNINNVETWATVAPIIERGAEWFSSMGTEKSKGTKVFSLVGKINNTGLIEVLMGTTLRTIIDDIGGGIPNGKQFKAVQTGGPSGGCIPADMLDLPVDYERLTEAGSIMGSGGMIVMDEDTCIVDVAKYFLEFTNDESCGKCMPCRDGSDAMLQILERICGGEGNAEDLDTLEQLSYAIKDASMCGLGQTLPNPVLSTLKYFRAEYEAHVRDKKCPAKVCKPLIRYRIDPEKCTGCGACARACPTTCISGARRQPHEIDQAKCIKCGICMETCKSVKFNAVRCD